MMAYQTVLSQSAAARFQELKAEEREEVRLAIDAFTSGNDQPNWSIFRTGEGFLQLRIGGRLVASVNEPTHTIYIDYIDGDTAPRSHSSLQKEEALKRVTAGIGSRPDLPSGSDYVRGIRKIWKGLQKSRDS